MSCTIQWSAILSIGSEEKNKIKGGGGGGLRMEGGEEDPGDFHLLYYFVAVAAAAAVLVVLYRSTGTLKWCLFVGWLLNVPATCECISGTDLHRQFYVLPH